MEGVNQQTTQRRASSVTTLSKGMARYRGSFATTRTSFAKTATQGLSKDVVKEPPQPPPEVTPFEIE